MHVMKRFTLTLAALTGLGIAPLIGQTSSLQTVPLSADIDVVNVRTLSIGARMAAHAWKKPTVWSSWTTVHKRSLCSTQSRRLRRSKPLQWLRRTGGSQSRLNLNFKLPGAAWAARRILRRPISE